LIILCWKFLKASHHVIMLPNATQSCSPFETPMRVPQFSFFSSSDNLGIFSPCFASEWVWICSVSEHGPPSGWGLYWPTSAWGWISAPEWGFLIYLASDRVFEIVLSQIETDKTVLHQSNIVTVNCQWLHGMKMLWILCQILGTKLQKIWPQLWHMVQKNWLVQLEFCWMSSTHSPRCMHGLVSRIKLLSNLNADLLS